MYKTFSRLLLAGVLMTALAGLARAQTQNPESDAPGRIIVVRVAGEVYVFNPAETFRFPLKQGSLIAPGQMIATGRKASVMLAFSNGATVTIGENSAVSIDEFSQKTFSQVFKLAEITKEPSRSATRLNVVRGDVIANVKKLNAEEGSKFEVKTPVGLAGIRGTTFHLAYSMDDSADEARQSADQTASFNITMLEGTIEFNAADQSATVTKGTQLKLDNLKVDGRGAVALPDAASFRPVNAPASLLASLSQKAQAMMAAADNLTMSESGIEVGPANENGGSENGSGLSASPGAQNPAPRLSPTDGVKQRRPSRAGF